MKEETMTIEVWNTIKKQKAFNVVAILIEKKYIKIINGEDFVELVEIIFNQI